MLPAYKIPAEIVQPDPNFDKLIDMLEVIGKDHWLTQEEIAEFSRLFHMKLEKE